MKSVLVFLKLIKYKIDAFYKGDMMNKNFWTVVAGVFFIAFIGGNLYSHSRPDVSVVLPTYNRGNLLPAALDSILNQTYKNFEFIIIDNGSTDNTAALLKSYQQTDKRIKIITLPDNRGISAARNLGNAKARGKYIVIMDSDDISLPNRLEKQIRFMEENPKMAAASSWKKELESGKVWTRSTEEQEMIFWMHFNNIMGHPETIMRRDFLEEHNITYNERLTSAVDYDLFKQIIFAGGKIGRQPDVILLYRMHMENGKSYYRHQALTRRAVSRAFLKRYGIDWNGDSKPTCDLIRQMRANNDKVGWLSNDFLHEKEKQICYLEQKLKK